LLYRRHAQRVWRYCLRCLRRPADAEDALQQTFLQAHRALGRGVEPVAEAAWLLTIARNVCLTRADAHRRRYRAEVTEDPQLLDELVGAEVADEGVSAEVQAAFARLPERQRQALFMREWQEWSYAEIADALGTSESAVETLLFRARRTLARELGGSRRRLADLAGLLGWLRTAAGATASKVAIGAAVVAATAVGTEVAATAHAKHGADVRRPPVVTKAPSIARSSASHVGAARPGPRVRNRVPPKPAPLARSERTSTRSPAAAAAPVAVSTASPADPTATGAPARPAPAAQPPQPAAPSGPQPPQQAAPSAPATPPTAAQTSTTTMPTPTPVTSATTSTAVDTVTTATGTVSSVVAPVTQTVSSAAPVAAPVATTAAQTVDTAAQTASGAAQTAGSTTQSAVTTVTTLLPGH
jgi:RNA polymerase sigma-70 factor (ECF subfamily)